MVAHDAKAGFVVPEALSPRNHYIKILGMRTSQLEEHKDAVTRRQTRRIATGT
ncbi:hypothetical protein NIIDNTM18_10130 [Mycolicibacterium litorale]|uniref:Uncharacterized protein n=2 Tax=Mycolicibacterium litorale TaxID=758802 RepID=A0A6S6P045_9MYCO|nr:hypothetical protein NIIDNTM18_10130 [Mycolicibacterium litorale]